MKKKHLLLLMVLLFSGCFGFVNILPRFLSVTFIWVIILANCTRVESKKFNYSIIITFAGVFISMVSCYVFRKQMILDTFFACSNIWQLGLFFYFCRKSIKISDLAWALNTIGVIVAVLYLMQYVLFLFGIHLKDVDDSMVMKGDAVRFRIACSGAIYFTFFQKLYEFMKFGEKKKTNLAIIVLICLVSLIMNFRVILCAMLVCSIFLFYKMKLSSSKKIKYLALFSIVGLIFFNTDFVQSKVDQLMERQQGKNNFSNEDYARIRGWNYYNNVHFTNSVERVLGSGVPSAKSVYGSKMIFLEEELGIFYADWGLIGYSWVVGVISVLGMLSYAFIAFRCSKRIPYLNVWFLFMVLSSTLTAEYMRAGNFMIQAMVLAYIAKVDKIDKQLGVEKK